MNEKHQKHLEKRNSNFFNSCGFFISLGALLFLLVSIRVPSFSEIRDARFARNLVVAGNHRTGGGELKFLEKRASGNQSAAERTRAPRGAVDLDRLARAIAVAETSGGSRGVALTHNNYHGLKEKGAFIRFDSPAASTECFKKNWLKHYGNHFPSIDDARKYTGNDRAESWLKHVKANY